MARWPFTRPSSPKILGAAQIAARRFPAVAWALTSLQVPHAPSDCSFRQVRPEGQSSASSVISSNRLVRLDLKSIGNLSPSSSHDGYKLHIHLCSSQAITHSQALYLFHAVCHKRRILLPFKTSHLSLPICLRKFSRGYCSLFSSSVYE